MQSQTRLRLDPAGGICRRFRGTRCRQTTRIANIQTMQSCLKFTKDSEPCGVSAECVPPLAAEFG